MGHRARHRFFSADDGESRQAAEKQRGPDASAGSAKTAGNLDAYTDWFRGLSFIESVCWAFETVPSQLAKILWKYTREDIKIRTRLRLGEGQAHHVQQFQTIATLLSRVLGGESDKSSASESESSSALPKNFEDAQRQLAAVFGKS
jgi:hypothetical protein